VVPALVVLGVVVSVVLPDEVDDVKSVVVPVRVTLLGAVLCKLADVVVLRQLSEQWLAGQLPRAQFL
jgi:hypothetical protein